MMKIYTFLLAAMLLLASVASAQTSAIGKSKPGRLGKTVTKPEPQPKPDTQPPTITLTEITGLVKQVENTITINPAPEDTRVTIRGVIEDNQDVAKLLINRQEIPLGGASPQKKTFGVQFSIPEAGESKRLEFIASDKSGNFSRVIYEIISDLPLPPPPERTISVNVDEDIPRTGMNNPDAVAVVIGIADYLYRDVPGVEYAKNDALVMREYLVNVLGYKKENILPADPEQVMTAGALKTLIRRKLPDYMKMQKKSDLFIYYSGHGAPSTVNHKAYLVPADADPNYVNDDNAYRVEQFYFDLIKLNYGNLTVVIDACFSGMSGEGNMLLKQISPLVITIENPFILEPNTVLFTASGVGEVSNWYPEQKHGMFTYFFLKGLKGFADANRDKRLTVQELQDFLLDVDEGVPYWSRREMHRPQTPEVHTQNGDRILVEY